MVKNNSGDSMILIYIHQIEFMKKLVYYLDHTNIKYTTDLDSEYDYVLIAEMSDKMIDFAKSKQRLGKQIIFVSYLEEANITFYHSKKSKISKNYNKRLNEILNISSKVFAHFEITRKIILEKKDIPVILIPREIPIINISKNNKDIYHKHKFSRRKKKILIVDEDYRYIDKINILSNIYPKYQFILFGYKPDYLLKSKQKEYLHSISKNVFPIRYLDFNVFSDLCRISNLVIFFNHRSINMDYINITLLFKKQLLLKNNPLFQDFFINSKNTYLFQTKEELLLKFKKIMTGRVSNLTDNGYLLIKDNTFDEIIKKYNAYLI